MSIRGLRKWALLLTFWVALQTRCLRADQTITGNLTVTGTTDIQGSSLSMGTRSDNSNPGWVTVYTDGTTSAMEFDASRGANVWKWQENGGTSLKVQMTLDSSNVLSLYESGGAKIVLSPSGTSSFLHSVTFSGPGNTMPNQTLGGASSVLTEGLGDTRYLLKSGTATGTYAVALGSGTNASGNYSMAMGFNSTASGVYSTVMGALTTATGYFSTALGFYSLASSYDEVAMGRYNLGGANPASWVATDPLLELGNGTSSTSRSDAFVVYKNGNATISGNMTANGINNLLPNQTLTGSGSVITEGLGDTRYAPKSAFSIGTVSYYGIVGPTMGINGGSATGPNSFAAGHYSTASAWYSTALGMATATAWFSTALGASTASGNYSTALGLGSASGFSAVVSGYSSAIGDFSTALGESTASGYYSTAMGRQVTAASYDELVLGQANVGLGSDGSTPSRNSWVPTDPLFEVGNGTASSYYNNYATAVPSNAFVVYKNGNAAIQGNLTMGGRITAQPGGDIPMFLGN